MFVEWAELNIRKINIKILLWGLMHYLKFSGKSDVRKRASELRRERIKRTPFPLWKFRGVNPDYCGKLSEVGVHNYKQMLDAGCTKQLRKELSRKTGVPEKYILELVKLSDLARINGIKEIRARLYYDAGVQTIEEMAKWDPDKLTKLCAKFIERTKFDGVPPTPAEAKYSVDMARKLPIIIEL